MPSESQNASAYDGQGTNTIDHDGKKL